jgi:tripartite-type tricarboxylate transporter receptor subunit TctC
MKNLHPKFVMTRRDVMLAGATALSSLPGLTLAAGEEGYPSRPITFFVPFPAGGPTDRIIRAMTTQASKRLGQAFVIESKPGGSTTIAAQALANAKPDGYTLGVVPMLMNRLNALGRTKIDVLKDFSFIARAVGQTHGLVVRADSPFKSVADIVRAAKEKPGQITYGTAGVLSNTHVAMEDLSRTVGARLNHIPFKGGTESLKALIGGEIDLMADSAGWVPMVDAGKARLLATWGESRSARYPNVPTMKELGYHLVMMAPFGVGAPAGVDAQTLAKLRGAFREAIQSPEFREECDRVLAPVMYMDADEFRRFAEENRTLERDLVARLNLKALLD